MAKTRAGWRVKHRRPETLGASADEFYAGESAARYAQHSALRRMQQALTLRALTLLEPLPSKPFFLDAGCGTGISLDVLLQLGYRAVGVDVSGAMVKQARVRGLDARVADMRALPFRAKTFDALISISAFQWLLEGSAWRTESLKAVKEFARVLKPGCPAVIQFYPESESQALALGKLFVANGFAGRLVEDAPENARKRKVFLVFRREAGQARGTGARAAFKPSDSASARKRV